MASFFWFQNGQKKKEMDSEFWFWVLSFSELSGTRSSISISFELKVELPSSEKTLFVLFLLESQVLSNAFTAGFSEAHRIFSVSPRGIVRQTDSPMSV